MDAVLLDTDVFSFLLKRGDTRAELYKPHVKNRTVVLPFVSVGELYVWAVSRHWGRKKLAQFEDRLKSTLNVPYDLVLCRASGRVIPGLPNGRILPRHDVMHAVS